MSLQKNLSKSLAMQEKAKKLIPGMAQLLSKRPDMFSYGVWPGYYSKAEGAQVWDLDGNQYTDMSISGIGANVLGYADPDVDSAVIEAIKAGSSSSLNCTEEVELAELMCDIHPWADMGRFTRAGGEAMVVAVRIARAHTCRDKVAFCGYHGWHDWYIAANVGEENALGDLLIAGLSPAGVPKALGGTALPFHFNSVAELKKVAEKAKGDLAAIVFEPIRDTPPEPEFLAALEEVAKETGAVLIADEISSGFRLNSGGAHLLYGYKPDIAVFSKAIGNGYPIGVIIGKSKVMSSAQDTFISSTCWTERVGPTAALATVKKHRRIDASKHLCALGKSVHQGWETLAAKHGLDIHVSGIYPMGHFDFKYPNPTELKALYVQLMLESGFLASNLYYAMAAHTEEHVTRYLAAADAALSQIADAIKGGSVVERLHGRPSSVGFQRLT